MTRFFQGYPWAFWVVKLPTLEIVTSLHHLATDRKITFTENEPLRIDCRVPSESPEVYIGDNDGSPFVAEGDRAIVAVRREGGSPPWVVRATARIDQPTDDARTDGAGNAYTTLVAFDGWQVLNKRPLRNADGTLPGINGRHIPQSTNVSEFIAELVTLTEANEGATYIDYTTGHFDSLPLAHSIDFEHGTSIGEVLKSLCDDGLCDIVFKPVYDTTNGKLWQLNVYGQAGSIRREAIFAWNLPGRSLAGLSRLLDGLERGNKVQFYNGQGGPAVTLQTNAASVAKVGQYWYQEFLPTVTVKFLAEKRAAAELVARKDGLFTISGNPVVERSPIPLVDYGLGDSVPIYAAARGFREVLSGLWRVTAIPIAIADDGIETVEQLEVSTLLPGVGP